MEHRAKRSLGQNFLVDANICRKIVAAMEIDAASRVLEIGPGKGAISGPILQAGPASYLALEKDADLAEALLLEHPEAEVRCMDALEFPWESLDDPALRIAGNLPYNVGSRLIWDIVSKTSRFERAVFMVQYEVAQRLTALPGGKAYGALGVWVQSFTRPRLLFKVPPTVFRPQPKVDSAVVALFPLKTEERPQNPAALSAILRLCFQQRRKQLGNILKLQLNDDLLAWMKTQGIEPKMRPEVLSPGQLQALSLRIVTDCEAD
ncbi:MAG: 16S rRNA (adenine(1518)-N(6)/adenine(1519)-N(6))-dimethyltransferase RsmA [Desulfovibrio sp.]